MLGSFKIKLVGTFLALSVVPLAAAFWGFSAVAERSVTSSVDGRLEAGLNAGLAAFEDERQSAAAAAERLGRDPEFQAALARRDRVALRRLLPKSPPLRVETPDGFDVGRGLASDAAWRSRASRRRQPGELSASAPTAAPPRRRMRRRGRLRLQRAGAFSQEGAAWTAGDVAVRRPMECGSPSRRSGRDRR